MNSESITVVSPPSLDLPGYLTAGFDFLTSHYPAFFSFTQSVIGFLIGLSIPISIFLFLAIMVTVERLKSIRKAEDKIYNAKADMAYENNAKADHKMAERWDKVLQHTESQNPNDWRQAVLEADIILGELLTKMGYKGDGIGEQLQRVAKGDFESLNEAWEAHKVRNQLAHAGSGFSFSQHDARKTIGLYRKVFEEFFYI